MDLYSPVSMSDLDEYRTNALETLSELESSESDKVEAEETLRELLSIASEIGLYYSRSYGTEVGEVDLEETLSEIDFEDAECSTWYDSSDLEEPLSEYALADVPEHLHSYFNMEEYVSDHISECREFTHNGTTYYAT